MRWDRGYEATFYLTIVDPATWRDIARIELTGGTIQRGTSGLRTSGDIDCIGFNEGEVWARVWMDTKQGESGDHVALITGLTSTPTLDYEGILTKSNVQIYSVMKPLEDILLPRGWYAASNRSGADVIAELLERTPAPVSISGEAPRLAEAIIAEEGETYLSMIEKMLGAINWRIRLQGDGTIELAPAATTSSANFDPVNADYLEPSVSIERDWYSCPNVFRATSGGASGTARDDDPDSPLSTISRGREIWKEETAAEFNTGETIAEYAMRRLKEEQLIATSASYARRYVPDVLPGDLVYMHYPEQSLEGLYRIESQSIALGYAARTTEEATKL